MNEFGNYLYGLRRGAGMTQQELAEKLGVTNRTISKWETGETFPETAQLIPLANIFHVTVDELLRGTGRTDNREESAGASMETQGSEEPTEDTHHPSPIPSPAMAALIAGGIGVILLGAAALTLLYCLWDSPYVSAVALGALFAGLLAGVPLLIYGGVTTQFVPRLKNERDIRAFARFRCTVIAGIEVFLLGAALFTEGWLVRSYAEVLFVVFLALGCIAAALGCVPLIYGGIGWERHLQANPYLKDAEAEEAAETKGERLAGKISSAIMICATLAYLLMGILGDLWHPGWIVFPAAALVCGIVSIFLERK